MSIFKRLKKVLKPAVDVPRWIDYPSLSQISRTIFKIGKSYFVSETPKRNESFQEAIDRLKLSESDLIERQNTFTRLMSVWLCMFTLLFSYTIYTIFYHAWLSAMPVFIFSAGALIQAFRYHFWLFQIKQRKLGCSLNEWFSTYLINKVK